MDEPPEYRSFDEPYNVGDDRLSVNLRIEVPTYDNDLLISNKGAEYTCLACGTSH